MTISSRERIVSGAPGKASSQTDLETPMNQHAMPNAEFDTSSVAADQLKQFIERIERYISR